jgi:hypothetical protein
MLVIDKIQKGILLYNQFQKVLRIQHIRHGRFLSYDVVVDSEYNLRLCLFEI